MQHFITIRNKNLDIEFVRFLKTMDGFVKSKQILYHTPNNVNLEKLNSSSNFFLLKLYKHYYRLYHNVEDHINDIKSLP